MIRPKVSAIPTCVMAPWLTSLIMIAPVPAKTRAKVPNISAQTFFIRLCLYGRIFPANRKGNARKAPHSHGTRDGGSFASGFSTGDVIGDGPDAKFVLSQ